MHNFGKVTRISKPRIVAVLLDRPPIGSLTDRGRGTCHFEWLDDELGVGQSDAQGD
jgi:hypothetical protein